MIYIAIIVSMLYVLYMTKKNGKLLSSVSETSYVAKHHWEFVVFVIFLAVYILPEMYKRCSHGTRFLIFITLAGMLMAANTPVFRSHGNTVHTWGGVLCCASSQACLAFNCPILLLAWIPFMVYFLFAKDGHCVFWAEMTCMMNIFMFCLT